MKNTVPEKHYHILDQDPWLKACSIKLFYDKRRENGNCKTILTQLQLFPKI